MVGIWNCVGCGAQAGAKLDADAGELIAEFSQDFFPEGRRRLP